MRASDLVRLATQGATAVLLIAGTARLWELVVLVFAYGAGEAFFRPTASGFVPQTVSSAHLQQANALLGVTNITWTVLGPVVAGVLVATVGPGWAIGADGLTFLLSAALLRRACEAPGSEARRNRLRSRAATALGTPIHLGPSTSSGQAVAGGPAAADPAQPGPVN